jgi:phosphoenolpyruvate carboxykinase (ATP)
LTRLRASLSLHRGPRHISSKNCLAGADPEYSLSVRVITELAWHAALFAVQLLIRPARPLPPRHPDFTLLFVPRFQANPASDGTNSRPASSWNFTRGDCL